jgi:hypothetical protein
MYSGTQTGLAGHWQSRWAGSLTVSGSVTARQCQCVTVTARVKVLVNLVSLS